MADSAGATSKKSYDVAISFLSQDEAVARALADLLGDGLSVFPRMQENLAGTNGLESMREPFLAARVVVVLYREPWGSPNWTRVEQAAITDRFLKEGWSWLIFVQLDSKSKCHFWLPNSRSLWVRTIRHQSACWPFRHRVQERGGVIEAPTALSEKTRRIQRDEELRAAQAASFHDQRWIETTLHPQIAGLMRRTCELVDEIKEKLGRPLFSGTAFGGGASMRCILRDDRVSMNISWRQPVVNWCVLAAQRAKLISPAQFDGLLFFPPGRQANDRNAERTRQESV